MQSLVAVALGTLFPELCDEWHSLKQNLHEYFTWERTEKESDVVRDLANKEAPLQHALREAVVGHVINIFPYVHCQYIDQMQPFTRYSSLDRDGLSSTLGEGMESADLLYGFHLATHLFFQLLASIQVRLADIRALFPEFESVLEKHVKEVRFSGIPSKDQDFKALKLGMVSLSHLSENKHMRPAHRSELIQALVVKQDFQGAFQVSQRYSGFFGRWNLNSWFRSDPKGAELFRRKMQEAAARLSDSQFLQNLENTNEEDLQSAAQTAKTLALAALLSSTDRVVKKLTNTVLVMLRAHDVRQVQCQVEREESKVLAIALVEFIREVNNKSAGGKNS